jgi:hypothetical protein
MNKLPQNFELDRYGLHVRLVREYDAEFILKLRTSEKLSRYIHKTEIDIKKQIDWIREYKQREAEGVDYYFMFSMDGKRLGVCRIYNIKDGAFTTGSWVFSPDSPRNSAVIASLITNELAWSLFPDATQFFDTKKDNLSVVKYNKLLGEIIGSDDVNYYFKTTKTMFEQKSQRIYRMMVACK